jgi:hypothetical protein
MPSKTFMRKVASGKRAVAKDMRAAGLDPSKAADSAEYSRRIYEQINQRLAQNKS